MEDKNLEFKAVELEAVWLVGRETVVQQGKTAAKFVKAFREDGSNEYLQGLDARVSPEGDVIIWMGEYDGETKAFKEIPGVFVTPGSDVKSGFTYREIPRCTMGVCLIRGKTRNLSKGAHNKLIKLMTKAGYAPDYSYGFSMEYYSREKYEKDNEEYEFAYMLPCRKA